MRDREPTIRSRELGDGLRMAMERAGISGKLLAFRLGWSEPKVSRLLTGRRIAPADEVSAVLAICGVTGDERTRLMGLCREQDTQGWLQQFGSRLPKDLRTYIGHETKAAEIADFAALMLPGSLQTADYARALLRRNANVPADEVEERVMARLARQGIFSRDHRPQCAFFIHEFVLRLPAGDSAVMSDQLHQLLRLSVRSCISIRVIPVSFGVHAGMSGSFTLLESPEYKPVVYVEEESSGLFLEEWEEVTAYRRIVRDLAAAALNEGESNELIAAVAVELYGDREDQ